MLLKEMDDKARIRHIVRAINDAWRARRYDDIGNLVASDIVMAPPGADLRITGKDAFVQSFRDYDAVATTHEFKPGEPRVDIVGDTAVAMCPFEIVYELHGATYHERGTDLLVFSLSGEEWRVVWRTMSSEPVK